VPGRLEGKVAVIVGGARGIGEGIARRFIEEGAKVVIGDTEVDAGRAAAGRLGAHFVTTDITRPEHAAWIVAEALAKHGRLDIAIQNAGIYPWRMIEATPPEEWDKVMGVNLKGTFLLAQAALKPMKQQRSGRMIFTSSITGPKVSSPGHGHYSASKGGINGFIKAASVEFAPFNITVNGVEPGNILTDGMKAERSAEFIKSMEGMIPLGRLGTPRDVANAFLFLASDDAEYITGTTIVVDGGQTVPEGADFKVAPD